MSSTRYTFELNNFIAFLSTEGAPSKYHPLMDFLAQSELSFYLFDAPKIQFELVEEFRDTTELTNDEKTITFTYKQKGYTLTLTDIHDALYLPINNYDRLPSINEIKDFVDLINYANVDVNSGEVVRKYLRREWSYFFDVIIKVFYRKVSNFNAIPKSMQQIGYGVLYNKIYDLNDVILTELSIKLGRRENRTKEIYFTRFIMIFILYVGNEIHKN